MLEEQEQYEEEEQEQHEEEEQEEKKPVSLRTNQLIRGQEFCGNRYIYLEMAVPDVFDWLVDEIEEPTVN